MLSVSTIHIALSLFLALPPDDLSREITEVLERISHPSSGVSFKAVRLKTGEPIVDFNAEDMLVPASLQKLFTTAATLDALGTDHVFKLDLFADAQSREQYKGRLLFAATAILAYSRTDLVRRSAPQIHGGS